MKKSFIQSGITLAVLLGLSLPLVGFAATSTDQTSANQNTQSSQEVLVTPFSSNTPNSPQNQQNVTVTGNHILFRVANSSSNPVTFTIPDIGISSSIPAATERTIFVDARDLNSTKLTYNVADNNGSQISSGTVNVPAAAQVQSSTNISTSSLSDMINYSTAYNAPAKPEPVYYDRQASYSRKTESTQTQTSSSRRSIRGYF